MSDAARPDPSDDDDFPELDEMNGRMCIVTRESGSAEDLIRFVAGPDGSIVPDLKRVLPGRGCWVSISREAVDRAVARKLFARALRRDVQVDPDLGARIDKLLTVQLTGMMNLARKASQFVSGAAKVELAVRDGAALATFHASDAAADGVRKIDQARKAWHLGTGAAAAIPAFALMTGQELEELMGQNAFIHAAALAGQAGEGVVKRANLLERYRASKPLASAGARRPDK